MPDYEFIDRNDHLSDDMYGSHIPMGSLGQFFRKDIADFSRTLRPYIFDDKGRTANIKTGELFKEKLTCGLSWRSTNKTIGHAKSLNLSQFSEIIKNSKYNFVNLQYGDTKSELNDLAQCYGSLVHNIEGIELFNDVDGLLSIIQACDLVITSSNSTAHLAGAIGKETLLLVPYSRGKIWYWHDVEGRSLWYPSIRIFRQKSYGDWAAPLNDISRYLQEKKYG